MQVINRNIILIFSRLRVQNRCVHTDMEKPDLGCLEPVKVDITKERHISYKRVGWSDHEETALVLITLK